MPEQVCVTIVTYNSDRYIGRCLESVLKQEGVPLEVVVVDNASTDGTASVLKAFGSRIRVLWNSGNRGFCAAQNQAIAAGSGSWVLTLNPDVLLRPDFVSNLVRAGATDLLAGTVCGKLLSIGPGFEPLPEPRLDSTGIYFTPEMRHFDRAWGEPDDGRFDRVEYVFGASAAAALYRREMIQDLSGPGGFFDPDFFAYREDADVAWRAQLLGWRCIYTPDAVAHHVRSLVPGPRDRNPSLLNMHSVKNRFLMRIKNCTAGLYRRYWLAMTLRDVLVIGGCMLYEPASLPAFWHLAKSLGRALRDRRWILERRRVADDVIARWMRGEPVAEPLPVRLQAPIPAQAGD